MQTTQQITAPEGEQKELTKDQVLAGLRAKIGAIEKAGQPGTDRLANTVPLSLTPELDSFLPGGGLTRGALHEVVGLPGAQGAAAGFAAALMSLTASECGGQGTVLWCRRHHDGEENGELYGPGLAAFGLGHERLLEVRAGRDHDILWALEEGLQSNALCAVLGEISDLSFTASRRLQLAAEARGIPALVLRHNSQSHAVSAAHTRWRVQSLRSSSSSYNSRWQLNLLRCRGAMADSQGTAWQVEWQDGRLYDNGTGRHGDSSTATRGFALAAQAGQRPCYPTAPGLAV